MPGEWWCVVRFVSAEHAEEAEMEFGLLFDRDDDICDRHTNFRGMVAVIDVGCGVRKFEDVKTNAAISETRQTKQFAPRPRLKFGGGVCEC